MSEFWEGPLRAILQVKHGFAFPGESFSEDPAFPTLLTPGHFAVGGGFQTRLKTFGGPVPDGYTLAAGDLVVSMTDLSKHSDTLGLPARIPEDGRTYLHNQRIGLVQPIDCAVISIPFLNYFLRTRHYRQHIVGTASGSTVKHTSPSRILEYVARIPPFREQRAIAEVLGAFDDKIAANTTLARTANDLAAAHFDAANFAGDWSGKTYSDIATVGGGGTPRTGIAEYWDGPVSWATPTDVTALAAPYLESTARTITVEGLAACSSPLYPAGSILMTSRATIGAFAINTHPTAVNQGFIVVNPYDNQLRWWLFHEMRSRVAEYLSHANGATFLELSRGRFKALPVCLIDQAGLATFSKTAEALHASARQAHVENRALGTLRDTLLPHLMSGKLRVKDAERQVEAVV